MILVDTSVWVDYLRQGDAAMQRALDAGVVIAHPFVMGEIALGQLPQRALTLTMLAALPQAPVARADEVLTLIERHQLFGRGVGWVDVHLLASAALAQDTMLWTRDRRLDSAARTLGLALADRLH